MWEVTTDHSSVSFKFLLDLFNFRSLTPAKVYRLQYGKEANPSLKLKWEKAKQKREMERKNDKGSNKMAERVLLRVSQKLNGNTKWTN